MTYMTGGQLHRVRRAGDQGTLLSDSSFLELVDELDLSGWRRVHDAPGILVAWVNCEALYCHVAWDGNDRAVAWVSH